MSNQPIEFRSINNRQELEAVYTILGDIFPVGKDFFQQRLDHDSAYHPSTTWIGAQQGQITSTMQLFPFHSRVHQANLKIGGIGSVATVPEYRGLGHSKKLLHQLTEWMEEQEYDLSLLFAVITPFYEQAGWTVVPEATYELNTSVVRENKLNSSDYTITIVPFQSDYLSHLSRIYDQFNKDRACTAIRTDTYWQDLMMWPRWQESDCLLAIRNGVPVAYGVISDMKEDSSTYLNELCYVNGSEAAVAPLFQALLRIRPEADRISALPHDHALLDSLRSWGAVQNTMPYAMWKIIRLQPLLAKMTDVFQARLQSSKALADNNLQFVLECAEQQAYFHYLNGQLTIEPTSREEFNYSRLLLTQGELVTMLMQGYDSLIDHDNSTTADNSGTTFIHEENSSTTSIYEDNSEQLHDRLLQALFPKQGYVFYHLDKF